MRRGRTAGATLCLCAAVSPALAATRAGTGIANTATLTFNTGGVAQTVASNTVTLVAAETLDVATAAVRETLDAGSGMMPVGFVVTNAGNGDEEFVIGVASDQPGVAVSRVAIDSDDDGGYDAATDQMLTAGIIAIAPGRTVRLFVLVDGVQVTRPTRISATATAKTGSGTPGTVFAGAGDGGGDAVIGKSGATAAAVAVLSPRGAVPLLAKSQSVFAPDGSSRPVRGAIVTYSLAASFPVAARGVVLDDPVPPGSDYVAGSMSLDGRALSDATDGDAGAAGAAGVRVALGDVGPATTRTIQFSVKIQ